jgi:uncharacterized RDD family membrane protein YckC
MSAAQFEFEPQDAVGEGEPQPPASALKLQAAERLAAHRARRGQTIAQPLPGFEDAAPATQPTTRAARIAAAVAERYAHSPSYRAFLAAEAERAIQQADAAAEVAARTAKAVAATQQQLLSELEDWDTEEHNAGPKAAPTLVESSATRGGRQAAQVTAAAFTVKLYEDVGRPAETGFANAVPHEHLNDEDRLALDDEIAFRQAPSFDQFLEPTTPITANLIEFPRQLVAARRSRPRIAEGPLREDSEVAPESAQLRIFEVEPDQISTQILPVTDSSLPEWSSIRLGASPVSEAVEFREDLLSYSPALLTAPLGLRLMSAIVDGCLIVSSFLGFTTVAAYTAGHLPTGPAAAIAAAASLAILALFYYLMFFTFSEATPGMRYARIGLCTFEDDNPTRSAMRRRLVAILLAGCPLGLGFIWAWLDDEGLGWHDRISRMYQRSY